MITLQAATSRLATNGAVLEVSTSLPRHFLVGDLCWIDSNRLFWFTAHGDREDDGHVLEFDAAEMVDGSCVQFFHRGKRVGRLTDIGSAVVEDPEDYTVAFSIWQQVEPCSRTLIERSRAQFEAGDR